ncbi:Ndr [Aphelenchoides avenae]|nr:Ndr [Aphelenchus avenae]
MKAVKENSIFLHVSLPGQEPNAPDYAGDFPALEKIGVDMASVLDTFDVPSCVAIGVGSGASIRVCPTRVLCVCLLRCASAMTGAIERFKNMNLQLESSRMTQGAWDYLSMHRFGQPASWNYAFLEELTASLNTKNLAKYLFSFSKRADFEIEADLDT